MSSLETASFDLMKITLLGTGTPNPSLSRMGASYLVELGDDSILFDIGPGGYHRLLEAGRSVTNVTRLFLTHLHYDHCVDYARLVLTRWDQGRGEIPELEVCGPRGTAAMTSRLFGTEGAFQEDIVARTQHRASIDTFVLRGGTPPRRRPSPVVTEIGGGSVVEGDGWRVRSVEVPHVQPYLESVGYRLDAPGGAFAYSGDAGKSKAFIRLIEGCDVLVHMCHHISGTAPGPEWERGAAGHEEVATIAHEAGVGTLVVSHLPSQMDRPGVRERLIGEMAAIDDGCIIWGEDLLEVPVKASSPGPHVG